MLSRTVFSVAVLIAMLNGLLPRAVQAGDIRITFPKHAATTPVQELNRAGVEAVNKHQLDKAKKLFYKAYLLDPNDPFTLNNLGYVSELEGSVDRAQRFYALAREQSYGAVVDQSSKPELRGMTVAQAAGLLDKDMQVDRVNLEAVHSLQKNRVSEAEDELKNALKIDPNNPFTLNNMGLVREEEGDLQGALNSYRASSSRNSADPAIVIHDRALLGHPITEVSRRNAERIQRRLPEQTTLENRTARFNFLGVSAVNRNDVAGARHYFEQAIALDPNNGFALNNMGYLSEMDGDPETADMYYQKAQTAEQSSARVTASTRREVLGMTLDQLSQDNDSKVNSLIDAQREARRRHRVPIQLKRRDNTPVIEPAPTVPTQ
jgi:Flp pilus assembly protein TadD